MELDLTEVVRVFQAESAEGLAAAEQALMALEARPDDTEAVATVFRVVHTVKGNAASLDYRGVAALAHVLEDTLHKVRDGQRAVTSDLVGVLLRGLDGLEAGIEAALAGRTEATPEQAELLHELSLRAASPSPPTSAPLPGRAPVATQERRPSAGARPASSRATLRVDLSKLDRMLDLTGELAIAHGRLRQGLAAGARNGTLEAQGEVERLFADLQELVMQVRLVPLGPIFRHAVRTVRDLAAAHGRLARLEIEGEDVEVDTSVVEHVRDPLTHMIRNALDHGIEAPALRRSKGKDPCGVLRLGARRDAGSILIELEDDGAGLDHARILARARTRGWLAADAEPTPAELERLVFEPGFSTAATVNDLSGRGVGLDVVRRNVEALRGSASIGSRPAGGTIVSLRLPLTLAIIPGLVVEVGGETYVAPLDAVVECLDLDLTGGKGLGETGTIELRGRCVPCLRLAALFSVNATGLREQVVLVRSGSGPVGLVVDRVVGESQSVVKPLGPLFRALRWFSGGTILGDGQVAPILDVAALVQSLRLHPAGHADARVAALADTRAGSPPKPGAGIELQPQEEHPC